MVGENDNKRKYITAEILILNFFDMDKSTEKESNIKWRKIETDMILVK